RLAGDLNVTCSDAEQTSQCRLNVAGHRVLEATRRYLVTNRGGGKAVERERKCSAGRSRKIELLDFVACERRILSASAYGRGLRWRNRGAGDDQLARRVVAVEVVEITDEERTAGGAEELVVGRSQSRQPVEVRLDLSGRGRRVRPDGEQGRQERGAIGRG